MSDPRPAPTSGDQLLRAVTDIAVEVQRAQTVQQMLQVAAAGLERLDYDVAIFSQGEPGPVLQYLTRRTEFEPLTVHDLPFTKLSERLQVSREREKPRVIADLPGAVRGWLGPQAERLASVLKQVKARAVVAPLRVGERAWGAIVFMHDSVGDDEASVLSLFALQLGSALDLADHLDRLGKRTTELELMHQLAVASPRTDTAALGQRALELICRTTDTEAAVLHRYDATRGDYELVNVTGYRGVLIETFRRFSLPPSQQREPVVLEVAKMPVGSAEALAAGFRHMAILPMYVDGPVGVMTLGRKQATPWSASELRLAEILGVQTSALLERSRLWEDTNRLYSDLKKSYDELGKAQAELVRHERLAALGELAAVMAHEVRNPLGVIFNSLTTLKRLLKPTGDADMLLNIVGEEADRLNRIVGDLLDFVRPYELMKKPIAVEQVVTSAVDAASQTLSGNVRVVTEFRQELPPFPADSHMLKQAVVNLVVNAVQAMPKGGTVTVSVGMEPRPDGAWLRIDVRDEGVGLTARAAEKMFQPFFTTKATGTGLGLAVVKRIVDGHFGEVAATPNADHGTTFTVRLPPVNEREAGGMTPPRVPAVRSHS